MRKAKTRTNQKYLKMSSRNSSRIFWNSNEEHFIHYKICSSPEESDEEKANRKREKVIEIGQTQQETLQETQRTKKRQENSKKAAEEGTAHIDEVFEYQSETDRSRVKLGRRHQQASKKAKLDKLE
jgi:hypothetical protein